MCNVTSCHNDRQESKIGDELAELCHMFPDKSELEICKAYKNCNNNLETTCEVLLSGVEEIMQEPTLPNERDSLDQKLTPLDELVFMFPNIDRESIQLAYRSNNKSLNDTVSDLLNFEILAVEEGHEQEELERQIRKRFGMREAHKNDWAVTSDRVEIIQNYTNANEAVAMKAYYDSSLSAVKAIIKIIWTTERQIQNNAKPSSKRPFSGGKVQSVNGFAYSKRNAFEALEYDSKDTGKHSSFEKVSYVYNSDNQEAKGLNDMLQANTVFKCIDKNFLKKALEFYNGDVRRTTSLALFLIESNASKYTYHESNNLLEPVEDKDFTKTRNSRRVQKSPMVNTNSPLNPNDFRISEHYELGCQMIDKLFISSRLDFHGFVPDDAIRVLQVCLKKWWEQEVLERELNGKKLSVTTAYNVKPLEIVTGRGIHSVGGISVLKKKVKMFLDAQNYVFWEEPSYFIVNGRKTPR